MIQRLESEAKVEDIGIYDPSTKIEEKSPDEPAETISNEYVGGIVNGVEVVDVKAIEKKTPRKVDKFGIPIQPGEHRNFDRI